MVIFPRDNSLFVFGYNTPDGSELRLNSTDNSFSFEDSEESLKSLSHLVTQEWTLFFPFDLNINEHRFACLSDFSLDDWYIAAGLFNLEQDRCYRVFLINRKDHDLAVSYDFGSQSVLAIATNGFGLFDENGEEHDGEDVYDLLSFNRDVKAPLPVRKAMINETVPPEKGPNESSGVFPSMVAISYSKAFVFSQKDSSNTKINDGSFYFSIAEDFLKKTLTFLPSERVYLFGVEKDDPRLGKLQKFDSSEWFILGIQLSPTGSVHLTYIALKDDPSFTAVVSTYHRAFYTIASPDFWVNAPNGFFSKEEVLSRLPAEVRATIRLQKEPSPENGTLSDANSSSAPVNPTPETEAKETANEAPSVETAVSTPEVAVAEPRSEEEKQKTEIKEETNEVSSLTDEDNSFIEEQEKTTSLQIRRHVYVTRKFTKTIEELTKKYRDELTEKLGKIYQTLLTDTPEDLEKYLRLKRSTEFNGLTDFSIFKFRVANSGTFQACRIFYLIGSDLGRNLEKDAIVLLYFSDTGEHDQQGEIAERIERQVETEITTEILDLSGADIALKKELYQVAFQKAATPEKPRYSEYGVLSLDQASCLQASQAPCAFSGSAGTGKTLMSIDLYRSLLENDPTQSILYLTYQEALKNQVQRSFDELEVPAKCLTYKDVVLEQLGDGVHFADFATFSDWIRRIYVMTRDNKNTLAKIAPDIDDAANIVYVFYRGVIEGSSKNYTRRVATLLSLNEFLKESEDEHGFTLEQKKKIHEVAPAYRGYLNKEGWWSDNRCAEALLQERRGSYDAIIVDETQDLTELQVLSICALLKKGSKKLYLFGDDNQAINPTIFTIEDAAGCLKMELGPGINVPIFSLKGAYRSSNFLVNYINQINRIKRSSIGAQGNGNDDDENSLRKDEKGSLPRLITNKELEDALFSSPATFQSDTMVIVANERQKQALLLRYPQINAKDVSTIFEAKGREWDNVIINNLLSSSRELWDEMLSEEKVGKKSTLHRMLFNRYYVALTRAKDRIIVVEDNVTLPIYEQILKPLSEITKAEEIPQYLTDSLSEADWFAYALRAFNDKDFATARRCFNKIDKTKQDEEMQTFGHDLDDYEWFRNSPSDFAKDDIHEIAGLVDAFIRHRDKTNLIKLYSLRGAEAKQRILQLDDGADLAYISNVIAYLDGHPEKFIPSERAYFTTILVNLLAKEIQATLTRMETIFRRP